jgi:DNA-binding response OmpR family regulator
LVCQLLFYRKAMDDAVLIIDRDLGGAFALGQALDKAGFHSFPARAIPEAEVLLNTLHLSIDVLILDCRLPGAEGLIRFLSQSRRPLRVICLNEGRRHTCVKGIDAVCHKPLKFTEGSKAEWTDEIREILLYPADLTLRASR